MGALLLDTHVLLWAAAEPERLRPDARAALGDAEHELLVSAVSIAEIEIKRALGKLRLDVPASSLVAAIGGHPLSLTHEHAARLSDLPSLHRDPFDRLLIAQAQAEQAVLVTADAQVLRYDVATLRA